MIIIFKYKSEKGCKNKKPLEKQEVKSCKMIEK
jgi:hypothetical protein